MRSGDRRRNPLTRVLLFLCVLGLATPAAALPGSGYDSGQAGHPLRIAAYLLHPIGVVLDRLIFRPAWRLGQQEPFREIVGAQRPRGEEVAPSQVNPFLVPYSEDQPQ